MQMLSCSSVDSRGPPPPRPPEFRMRNSPRKKKFAFYFLLFRTDFSAKPFLCMCFLQNQWTRSESVDLLLLLLVCQMETPASLLDEGGSASQVPRATRCFLRMQKSHGFFSCEVRIGFWSVELQLNPPAFVFFAKNGEGMGENERERERQTDRQTDRGGGGGGGQSGRQTDLVGVKARGLRPRCALHAVPQVKEERRGEPPAEEALFHAGEQPSPQCQRREEEGETAC